MIGDASSISKNMNDAEVTGYAGWKYPFRAHDASKLIQKYRKGTQDGTCYALGIEEKGKNAIIGTVAFIMLDEQKIPAIDFWIGRAFWRRGYAEDALRLMIAFGFRKLHLNMIYSAAYQKNMASNNLLLKVGFKEYKRRFTKLKGKKIMQIMYVMKSSGNEK